MAKEAKDKKELGIKSRPLFTTTTEDAPAAENSAPVYMSAKTLAEMEQGRAALKNYAQVVVPADLAE